MFSRKKQKVSIENRGFSLLEVLITSAIIGIVTAVVVVKYGAFNSTILLKNQAYEIAIAIREAQVYSISTRAQGSAFREAYGVAVDLSATGSNQKVILFLDNGTNQGRYDDAAADSPDTIVETLVLDSRFEITGVRADTTDYSDETLSITFVRPDFDAKIRTDSSTHTEAAITLASVDGSGFTRTVIVSNTGQISVQ